ncbi:MAG: MarR family transcriptional regulator, partial [Cyanobacteria bacterium]|nr:MarR family transcriptional regulator [Cyanobacteriota bacterium]
WVVLCRLWQEDGVQVSEVGQYLEQIGGSLTGVLERMEDRGLIRRERDEKDRRSFRIWLTEDGERLMEILPPIARSCIDFVCDGISAEDVQFFKDSLNQMLLCLMEKG